MSAHQYQGSWQAFEVQVKRDVRVLARDGIGLAYRAAMFYAWCPGFDVTKFLEACGFPLEKG